MTDASGGALARLTAARPEIGVNTTSARQGIPDIGLGAMLGSNILAIPLMVTVAHLASRRPLRSSPGGGPGSESQEKHERHRRNRLLRGERQAVSILALPYLGIVGLVALLTLPAPWRGLQPIDGWIMLGASIASLGQAIRRGRRAGANECWSTSEIVRAVAGAVVLAIGAYFIARATENLTSAWLVPRHCRAWSGQALWRLRYAEGRAGRCR